MSSTFQNKIKKNQEFRVKPVFDKINYFYQTIFLFSCSTETKTENTQNCY